MKKSLFPSILFMYTMAGLLLPSLMLARTDTTATWKFNTGAPVYSSPACDSSSIYIGSDNGKLYSFNGESGKVQWIFETGGLIRCKPAIIDTSIYIESEDGYAYAVNKKSGLKSWSTSIGNTINTRVLPSLISSGSGNSWDYMQSSPCVDSGMVYVGSGDSSFYALNSTTGAVQWKFKTGNVIRSSPCVVGKIVYVGSWDGYLYALNKTDGSVNWKYQTGGYVQESPRFYKGLIYCGCRRGGYVYALDAVQGTLQWTYYYDASFPFVESSPLVENNTVYVGSSDQNTVFAFDATTGKTLWTSMVPGVTWSSPIIKSGTMYIGLAGYGHSSMEDQMSGALLAINASTGAMKWRCNTGDSPFIGGVVSSPAVARNLIYYGSLDGFVYAVDTAFSMQPKWCAADFTSQTTDGKAGFYVPRWSSGSVERITDRKMGNVLQGNTSISAASPVFSVQRDSVPLQNGEGKATGISFMIKVPASMPAHGLVKFYATNSAHDSIAVVDTIGSKIKTDTWTVLWLPKLDTLARAGKIDLSKPATVGVSISYPAPYDTTKCTGTIYFDNLWIYGLSFSNTLIDGVARDNSAPRIFHLKDNYPNPFNPTTTIEYQVSAKGRITLRIYDILGKEVATLVDGMHNAGNYKVTFDGSHLASGVYFDRLTSGTSSETKTFILMK